MNIAITSKTIQNAHYIFAKQTPITISNADSKLYGLKGSSWSNIVLWNDRQLFFITVSWWKLAIIIMII